MRSCAKGANSRVCALVSDTALKPSYKEPRGTLWRVHETVDVMIKQHHGALCYATHSNEIHTYG